MNTFLNHLSWSVYLEITGMIAVIYYAIICWKYFRKEISGVYERLKNSINYKLRPAAYVQNATGETINTSITDTVQQPEEINWNKAHQEENREIYQHISACIATAAADYYMPEELISKLKYILRNVPQVVSTPQRDNINCYIVQQCEQTGTALLSVTEVDLWWSA